MTAKVLLEKEAQNANEPRERATTSKRGQKTNSNETAAEYFNSTRAKEKRELEGNKQEEPCACGTEQNTHTQTPNHPPKLASRFENWKLNRIDPGPHLTINITCWINRVRSIEMLGSTSSRCSGLTGIRTCLSIFQQPHPLGRTEIAGTEVVD